MALTKNLSRQERTFKLAAKLCLASSVLDFIDQYLAEELGLSEDEFAVFEDQFKNIEHELCRGVLPGHSIKQNIKIAKDYYADYYADK